MVTIYGSDSCFHCLKSKQLCETMEIPHKYLNVNETWVVRDYSRLFPDAEGIPQILWNDEPIGGYTALAKKIDDYIINLNKEK